jgi:hypothetical protein
VVGVALLAVTNVAGDVALLFSGSTQSSGAKTPLMFINGANYAAANAEGFVTVAYATTQQVSLSASVRGANGAYGSYLLDVVEVEAVANTSLGWHLHLDVTKALAATGVNALYLFDCTASPTAVPDTGPTLASGTDVAGDPWAIFSPTCTGTQGATSLLSAGTGLNIPIPALAFGQSVLYLSFALSVSSGGASTASAATITLIAVSP